MDKIKKEALQVTKEIVVKFVEAGRVTPTNFPETFPAIYSVVLSTISGSGAQDEHEPAADEDCRN